VTRYRQRRARRLQQEADINVTAFMNLMVVLVPFLLVLAVFSRITIHELTLPGSGSAAETPSFELEVTMRADKLILSERGRGQLLEVGRSEQGYDLEPLRATLLELKQTAPDTDRATLLAEGGIDYQSLITVMDVVRGDREHVLFPRVAVGDAPPEEPDT